eukprot:8441298-Alexandrium_andersonii.AAC.1
MACRAEDAKTGSKHCTATAFDMFKSFDQVNRQVLYVVLLRLGFLRALLSTYARYMENLEVVNSFSAG